VENNIAKPESFWARHSGLLAISIALVGFTLGMLQDIFLVREGFSRWSLIILSNMFTGSIAGLLFYQYARNERDHRDLVRQRMLTIVELNHHIRNALQVIKFWGVQHQNCTLDDAQAQLMKDSVDRIEWALREVLPRYPEPTMSVRPAAHEASSAVESPSTTFYTAKVNTERKP
jgi:hypothetical protein